MQHYVNWEWSTEDRNWLLVRGNELASFGLDATERMTQSSKYMHINRRLKNAINKNNPFGLSVMALQMSAVGFLSDDNPVLVSVCPSDMEEEWGIAYEYRIRKEDVPPRHWPEDLMVADDQRLTVDLGNESEYDVDWD